MSRDDPNYEIIAVAKEELLDTSGDLMPVRKVKEPVSSNFLESHIFFSCTLLAFHMNYLLIKLIGL